LRRRRKDFTAHVLVGAAFHGLAAGSKPLSSDSAASLSRKIDELGRTMASIAAGRRPGACSRSARALMFRADCGEKSRIIAGSSIYSAFLT
jgi:hypothetical protein